MHRTLGPRHYALGVLVAAGLSAGLLALVVQLFPMYVFPDYFPIWQQVRAMAHEPGPGSHVLIVGDSRPKAGLLTEALDHAVSLTLPGCTPADLYFVLREYLSLHERPEAIAFSISPVHLQGGEMFWNHTARFGFLHDDEVAEVFHTAAALHDPSLGDPRWLSARYLAYRVHSPHLFLSTLAHSLPASHVRRNRSLWRSLEGEHGHLYFGDAPRSAGLAYETTRERFRPDPIHDFYLRALLELGARSARHVAFVSGPINRASAEAIRSAYRRDFLAYVAELARAFPAIAFDADWPVYPDDHFGDPNHLNERGARRFTDEVAMRLHVRRAEARPSDR